MAGSGTHGWLQALSSHIATRVLHLALPALPPHSTEAEAVDKPENALDALSWALSQSKLNKHWTPEHPLVAKEALRLAVQLRDARKAREVLQNYARVAINNNPAALETAIRQLLNNALSKAREAQQEADSLAADIAAVEDLEETEASPEAMLMSMMSTDGAAERAVRGQTLPWLRIAWECHRIVLDVLRNLPKLESLYHKVVLEMIEFCKEFKRVQEIKKLCAQLRAHLRQFRARVEDAEEPITEESVDGQLATRFAVLEYACSQSLWNEAFRVVSDIHNIVDFCGTKPSTEMMATYYASLARVFWVSDNVLFHAYALWKYKQQRCHVTTPGAPQPEAGVKPLARASSAVVMAALAVPLYVSDSADDSSRLFAGDSTSNRQRKQRLAKLLEYAGQPSRADILRNLAAENVLASVEPQVAPLLGLLEESFSPLDLVAQLTPTLQWAASKPSLAQYVPALERLAVHRVLQQLSRVYDVVSLDTFHGLLKGLSLPQVEMEKLIVRTADAGALAVRVDHAERVLRLGRSSLESSAMRLHLAHLGAAMSAAMTNMGKDSAGVANARMESAMALAREFSEQTRQENLARMAEIDARVEVAEVAAERAAREVCEHQRYWRAALLAMQTCSHTTELPTRELCPMILPDLLYKAVACGLSVGRSAPLFERKYRSLCAAPGYFCIDAICVHLRLARVTLVGISFAIVFPG